jgi:iron complex transport system ATP-binding protein
MTQLAAIDLSVRRSQRAILSQVSLRAQAGEFVAIIGPNGAGKSTLLSAMAGLLRPDSGRVLLDEHEIRLMPGTALARRRSYLPQSPRCEWALPVYRLIALGLTPVLPAFGGFSAADQERVDRVLRECDLTERSKQAVTTLSGGELARAMLARALVSDPDVLLVDEPIAGLDPRHALDCMTRLKASAQSGKLVIAALHDLTLAARYATRIVAMRGGQICADGPPREVLTAQQMQTVFSVDARINEGSGGLYIDFVGPAG